MLSQIQYPSPPVQCEDWFTPCWLSHPGAPEGEGYQGDGHRRDISHLPIHRQAADPPRQPRCFWPSAKCIMVWKSQLNNSATMNSHTDSSRSSQMLPDRLSAKRWALRCSEMTSHVLHNVLEVVKHNTRIFWRMYGSLLNTTKSNY